MDSQKHSPQLELETIDGNENQDNSIREQRKENALTYLIVLGIAFIVICGWFFIVLLKESQDLLLKNLRTVTFTKIIIDNIIPIILIIRNDSMFKFFKIHYVYKHFHVKHIFKRCLCPNQIEPMIEVNVLWILNVVNKSMYHFSIDYKLSTNLLMMILKYQQLHFLVG